uniref:mucin-5AC-like n=1 Tax=Styela clava TaxID=7725 RepID=UPI00193AA3C4|nr:mucin-5AC-like [Styela clava]
MSNVSNGTTSSVSTTAVTNHLETTSTIPEAITSNTPTSSVHMNASEAPNTAFNVSGNELSTISMLPSSASETHIVDSATLVTSSAIINVTQVVDAATAPTAVPASTATNELQSAATYSVATNVPTSNGTSSIAIFSVENNRTTTIVNLNSSVEVILSTNVVANITAPMTTPNSMLLTSTSESATIPTLTTSAVPVALETSAHMTQMPIGISTAIASHNESSYNMITPSLSEINATLPDAITTGTSNTISASMQPMSNTTLMSPASRAITNVTDLHSTFSSVTATNGVLSNNSKSANITISTTNETATHTGIEEAITAEPTVFYPQQNTTVMAKTTNIPAVNGTTIFQSMDNTTEGATSNTMITSPGITSAMEYMNFSSNIDTSTFTSAAEATTATTLSEDTSVQTSYPILVTLSTNITELTSDPITTSSATTSTTSIYRSQITNTVAETNSSIFSTTSAVLHLTLRLQLSQ